MKHLIMGTAGHVDHGKTALVKALTGIECDTHREEKERGITIHLGFAHLKLPGDGPRIGIIDVPGHRDFIHTMVSGAGGIDFVLLVIAADSGVMPQTREHLQIMEILGIQRGIVALTRCDLVDDDFLELCEAEVHEYLSGTFLKDAPVLRVSAKTGAGLKELLECISRTVEKVESRPNDGVFRLYIDRIFSVTGFGTVVTGTAIGGTIRKDDPVFLLGGHPRSLKIRRLERYGEESLTIQAGDRASLNLLGLEKTEFQRGMVISDRILNETTLFDAVLSVHAPGCRLSLWSHVLLHTGTAESQARVHLIDKDSLADGESALVQIHSERPLFLQHGDRFVIRNSSCDLTIGGGEVIDSAPLHHRRRPERLVTELELIARNKLFELTAAEVRKSPRPLSAETVAQNLNISHDRVRKVLASGVLNGIVCFETSAGLILASQLCLDTLRQGVLSAVGEFRKRNPLSDKGIALDELHSSLRLEKTPGNEAVLLELIKRLLEKQKLREAAKTWFLFEDSGAVDPRLARCVTAIEAYMKQCGMQTPLLSQIKMICGKEGVGEKEMGGILYHLTRSGNVVKIEDEYLHRDVVAACREKLVKRLREDPTGIKVSDFRDLVGGNRKICLLLLARFDAEGTTVRDGDFRFLKESSSLGGIPSP
jgi:selenocysteine-specific elongation factor